MADIVIVGAGPAGSALGTWLAERGRDVVVVDRARFPRAKACGEGLFPRGVRALERLGVAEQMRECGARLEGIRFVSGEHDASAPFGTQGLGIRRDILDYVLLRRARAAGADVREGVTVRGLVIEGRKATGVMTTSGFLPARVVVAADGLQSALRRQAGLDSGTGRRYGVSAHVTVERELDPEVRVWFRRGHEVYLTPVGAKTANVAVLAGRGFMRRFAGDVRDQFVRLLPDGLARHVEEMGQPLAAGPFARGCTRAWRANVVLAGDAAGFFDGITGEGMSIALESARDCADAIEEYLASGTYRGFRAYESRRRALARNSTLLARVMLALSGDPRIASRAVQNLERQPETFARLVAISSGEAGWGSLRPRDLPALAFGV